MAHYPHRLILQGFNDILTVFTDSFGYTTKDVALMKR